MFTPELKEPFNELAHVQHPILSSVPGRFIWNPRLNLEREHSRDDFPVDGIRNLQFAPFASHQTQVTRIDEIIGKGDIKVDSTDNENEVQVFSLDIIGNKRWNLEWNRHMVSTR